jgi:hypothetical protein
MSCPGHDGAGAHRRGERGQAAVLLVGALLAVLVGGVVLGGVARGVGAAGDAQRAADLAALAGARAMHGAYFRLFEPPLIDGAVNPRHLSKAAYLELGRSAAARTAAANDARDVDVGFPDAGSMAPVRLRVTVRERFEAGTGRDKRSAPIAAVAEAELVPLGADAGLTEFAAGGGYSGPLAHRQGKPMRPDVALAFDRMEAGARADGVALLINSGFGSDAEQAILFARHPDPKWVARPGTSLHRSGTELDLGPPAAYPWLKANASRFHFVRGTRGRTGTTRRRNAISHSGAVPTSAMWRGSQDCGDP